MTRGCMVAIAWGLLGLGACGDDSAPSAPKGDSPAGEVVELEGSVSAEAGAGAEHETRQLAVGDQVLANETIVTGEGASVTIRLFHNDARWTLGEGQRREIRKSAAWNAPKGASSGDLLADNDEKQTAAAGRHAEREAAGTRATAATEVATEEEAAPESALVAEKEARKARTVRAAERERDERRAEVEKAVADKGVLKVLGTKSGGGSGDSVSDLLASDGKDLDDAFDSVGGLGLEGSGEGGGGAGGGTIGAGKLGTIGSGGGSGSGYGRGGGVDRKKSAPRPRVKLGAVRATGDLDSAVVKRVLRQHAAELLDCYEKALAKDAALAGNLSIEVAIDGQGKVTSVSVGGDAKLASAVRACLIPRVQGISFPSSRNGEKTSVVAKLTLGVEP